MRLPLPSQHTNCKVSRDKFNPSQQFGNLFGLYNLYLLVDSETNFNLRVDDFTVEKSREFIDKYKSENNSDIATVHCHRKEKQKPSSSEKLGRVNFHENIMRAILNQISYQDIKSLIDLAKSKKDQEISELELYIECSSFSLNISPDSDEITTIQVAISRFMLAVDDYNLIYPENYLENIKQNIGTDSNMRSRQALHICHAIRKLIIHYFRWLVRNDNNDCYNPRNTSSNGSSSSQGPNNGDSSSNSPK